MIVGWLRACYESDFCVNAETGETIRGRYYWARPGAQVYPVPHFFGPAVWLDPDERARDHVLGDLFANVSADKGEAPRLFPFTRRAEIRPSATCQPLDEPLRMTDDILEGLPRHCYARTDDQFEEYDTNTDATNPANRCWVAGVIFELQDGNGVAAEAFVRGNVPNVIDVAMSIDADDTTPRWIAWRALGGRGLILGATGNPQTWAMHALGVANGPVDVGPFYTSFTWWERAQAINQAFIESCGNHERKTFFAGYSYGGALAKILTASEVDAVTRLDYGLMTFGAPRTGNGQLYRRLASVPHVYLQNEGDPIPSLPPPGPILVDLQGALGLQLWFLWARFSPPPMSVILREDFSTYEAAGWTIPVDLLNTIAATIAARDFREPQTLHSIFQYRLRACST